MKVAKLTFSKGKVRGLGENVKFIHLFFLGKISLEKVIGAVLDRKEAILDYKKINLIKSYITDIFPKGSANGFGRKLVFEIS